MVWSVTFFYHIYDYDYYDGCDHFYYVTIIIINVMVTIPMALFWA